MRVSFFGGGTDLPNFCEKEEGKVVSTAIKKYIYIVAHKSFDDSILISYSKTEKTENYHTIQNTRVREAMKMTGITKGVEIHSIAEVPSGTGLGSSSSFTVGLLNALYAYQGKHVGAERLAKEACEIELKILQEPIGRQDQYAAAYGGFNSIKFLGEEVRINPLVFKKEIKNQLEKRLMSFYIGGQREASEILAHQNKEIKENESLFEQHRILKKVADRGERYLLENDLKNFGNLLDEGWKIKRGLAPNISNERIDDYYKLALDSGAIGGKILGAGGSGFLLLYAEPEFQESIRSKLGNLKEMNIEFDEEGSKIIYCDN